MQPGEEVAGGFLVACGDASELLDVIEEAFDIQRMHVEKDVSTSAVRRVGAQHPGRTASTGDSA